VTPIRFERIINVVIFDWHAFDWHAAEHEQNLRERGFGFDFAARIFAGRVLTQIDDRHDYGEVRVRAIGEAASRILVVIYTDRDDVRWIISARPANRKDRAQWLA
jgi:uncharacterized DUF497 family protein